MSGPSIRNWELATALSRRHDVTLAVPGQSRGGARAFRTIVYDKANLAELVSASDVVVCSGFLLHGNPELLAASHLVVDLYGPFALEGLHVNQGAPLEQRWAMAEGNRAVVEELLRAGDLFLCASERQRDFWVGWLDAPGRVNPATHDAGPGPHLARSDRPVWAARTPPAPRSAPLPWRRRGYRGRRWIAIWGWDLGLV